MGSSAGMTLTNILPGNAQHTGARREQQDSFGFTGLTSEFAAHGGVMAVLADGMGGLALGREASSRAVEKMIEAYTGKTEEESIPAAMQRAVREANRAVLISADAAGIGEGDAGTTIAAVTIHNGLLYWLSVGDSRIYLWRSGVLRQLSVDHVYSRQLDQKVAKGLITQEQAENDPERAALTSFLGQPEISETCVNEEPFPLKPGDKVVVCSDGLYNTLTEPVMLRLLAAPPQEAAENLVQEAISLQKPHQDNATVAILGYKVELAATARPAPATVQPGRTVRPAAAAPVKTRKRPVFALAIVVLLMLGAIAAGAYFGKERLRTYLPSNWHRAGQSIPGAAEE